MRAKYYFVLAAFLVAAALWKAGAPLLPVVIGVACAWLWSFKKPKPVVSR